MIIKSMKLENFRQFYGNSQFEFGTNNNNVTLIIGANGNGKTGIFRALMFVLYGDKSLVQDTNAKEINLVNTKKLEENKFQPVKASVELHFEFNDQNFIIRRSIIGIKEEGGKVQDRVEEPELFTFSESGDFTPYNNENITVFINRIIEPEIREFFFFDAERMQLLDTTKSEKSLSDDVQEGIIRLLQIKYLDESVSELTKIMRQKQSEINIQVNDERLDDKLREKLEIEESIENSEKDILNYKNEIKALEEEKEVINNKLSSNTEIKELQEKINKEIELLKAKEQNRSLYQDRIKPYLIQGMHYSAKDILKKNEVFLKEHLNSSSDMIPRSLLESTLYNLTCTVCRTRFEENSNQFLSVKKLLEDYQTSSVTEVIRNILELENKLEENENTYILEVKDLLHKLIENKEDIEVSEIEIKQLETLIGDRAANIENLTRLEEQLTIYKNDEDVLKQRIASAEYSLNKSEKLLVNVEREIKNLTEKHSKVKKDIAIKDMLEHFRDVLKETIQDYSLSITEEISHDIYNTFLMLLDKKDRNNYKEVIINENFEIKLLNPYGQNIVQDLSMGQGQIFSLSFILSLAKVASRGRSEINFPLFMDTPFARLSRENRDNLIKNIPNLTNQWILLLTDTEFTNTEKEIFSKYKKVGKIYVLENKDGVTTPKMYNDLENLEMGVL